MAKSKKKSSNKKIPKRPKVITVTPEEKAELLEALSQVDLPEGTVDFIKGLMDGNVWLYESVKRGEMNIAKLKKLLSIKTEKVISCKDKASTPKDPNVKPKGHGRNGADEYVSAKTVIVDHDTLSSGDTCPEALCDGRLYEVSEPGIFIQVTGSPLAQATKYQIQKLRCSLCETIFTANLPEGVSSKKYDKGFVAMLMLHKYFISVPFYRQSKLQSYLGIPLPSSTQWDLIAAEKDVLEALYGAFCQDAANGQGWSIDDTRSRILEQFQKAKLAALEDKIKKSCFTTGMISAHEDHITYLYLTDEQVAGKSSKELFRLRDPDLPAPYLMCDALTANIPEKISGDLYVLCYCIVHARRQFYELGDGYDDLVDKVMSLIGALYDNDRETKKLDAQARLKLHQEKSGPLMTELKEHLCKHEHLHEPNSAAGKAIQYILKRWTELTQFLRYIDTPLDNNITERALKLVIQTRKSAMFYKTLASARIASQVQTALYSAAQNEINPYDYMKTVLEHKVSVLVNPEAWLPWNYQEALTLLEEGKSRQAGASSTLAP